MKSKLSEELKLKLEPVAIIFTDEKPSDALQFQEGKRGCVASMLVAAASQGKIAVFDEKTYGCPGGGVGLCFGDTFTETNHPTEYLLSTGGEMFANIKGKGVPKGLERGERYYASPEVALKWKKAMPYAKTSKKYVVFKPLSKIDDTCLPELICIFANPDQISALVIMAGFNTGEIFSVLAPMGAACQSILFAYQESKKEHPKAILGLFDIAQRHRVPKEMLTFTVPYNMFLQMEKDVPESCLSTHSWEQIKGR